MARSVLSALLQANRAIAREAPRQQRAAARDHAASVRRAEQARKAEARARVQAERAGKANRKRLEREAKAAHVAAMEAEVAQRNAELAAIYDEIDSLLSATLAVDDHVELESLRRTAENPPFDRADLEIPTPAPAVEREPTEPVFVEPDPPRGLFGRKKKHAAALAAAQAAHAKAHSAWEAKVQSMRTRRAEDAANHARAERERLAALEQERARFDAEIRNHNESLDTLIANLGYGTADAVQEYVSIVMSNSVYPDHLPVAHTFEFEPSTAELRMRVVVPPPSAVPAVKAYKYKKSSDEITTTPLPQKDLKQRYSGAVHQIAIRSFHEVFEADRRGVIKMMSIEVGTQDIAPATGRITYVPFVAAATTREKFLEFDLSGVIPAATLDHLGAAVSKNPYALVEADTGGIRQS